MVGSLHMTVCPGPIETEWSGSDLQRRCFSPEFFDHRGESLWVDPLTTNNQVLDNAGPEEHVAVLMRPSRFTHGRLTFSQRLTTMARVSLSSPVFSLQHGKTAS